MYVCIKYANTHTHMCACVCVFLSLSLSLSRARALSLCGKQGWGKIPSLVAYCEGTHTYTHTNIHTHTLTYTPRYISTHELQCELNLNPIP
jgi:hypothetical protein